MNANLDDAFFERCLARGHELDLAHCVYGIPHWEGAFLDEPAGYYYFMAGFVRELGLTQIAELGTHYGGSVQAMLAGIPAEAMADARVVTVDVTHLNEEQLRKHGKLRRIHADSLAPETIESFVSAFDRHVDLLFVDTIHTFQQTLENTAVYANRLKPRFIFLDDIRLNPEMRRLWSTVETLGAGRSFDLSDLVDRSSAGFGLVECAYPFHWPESSARRRQLRRLAYSARLRLATAMPESAKSRLRSLLGR